MAEKEVTEYETVKRTKTVTTEVPDPQTVERTRTVLVCDVCGADEDDGASVLELDHVTDVTLDGAIYDSVDYSRHSIPQKSFYIPSEEADEELFKSIGKMIVYGDEEAVEPTVESSLTLQICEDCTEEFAGESPGSRADVVDDIVSNTQAGDNRKNEDVSPDDTSTLGEYKLLGLVLSAIVGAVNWFVTTMRESAFKMWLLVNIIVAFIVAVLLFM